MSENINAPQTAAADDEIDLRELFSAIWQGKWIIAGTSFVFAVLAVIYALSLPNIYKSEALLSPVSQDGGLSIPGQLGGLAALAGVNLGGGANDKTTLAIEVLKSRDFIGRFIEKYDLFIPVMAAEGWNRGSDSLIIDSDIFNTETNEWVRNVKVPFSPKPSIQETYTEFMKLLSVSQDKTSGMVTLSLQHYSPYLAKDWADKLVLEINEDMRNRELIEAQRSISYLNEQINQTNLADARAMLFSLVEEQTKTLMLANVRSEYVFKTVDPALIAERKSKPSRMLICILLVLIGCVVATFIVVIKHFSFK
ncbi:Wzz/FepE/Etk N-terminal domain-containing protein [Alishewanella sp. SMS8]|uniref:Wzz/FepE/Etk N-terminal domain-containing protein n=1 Tax=Alishewanella sp. SMS8 TaxID=2994676 RepID=UPI002740D39F|nr:Wzz/FepE/Etk N-terminal domain-containing protein [Alishewanella sp. SMS8]MDP5460131.1 Wzz/FepE/Etk N-terminal domain-containing protein [Alishewanella sp. SMS8]